VSRKEAMSYTRTCPSCDATLVHPPGPGIGPSTRTAAAALAGRGEGEAWKEEEEGVGGGVRKGTVRWPSSNTTGLGRSGFIRLLEKWLCYGGV